MQKWDQESHGPSRAESGEGHKGQQERLLQMQQQWKEDQGKYGLAFEWGGGPGDKDIKKAKELN